MKDDNGRELGAVLDRLGVVVDCALVDGDANLQAVLADFGKWDVLNHGGRKELPRGEVPRGRG